MRLVHDEQLLARCVRRARSAMPWANRRYLPPWARARRATLMVPDVGEAEALKRIWYTTPTDATLKLMKADVTLSEGDTHASYTVADFTNYVNKTLTATQTGSTWGAPATVSGTTTIAYAQLSWTCGASGNTIYGYWIQTSTPTLMLAEKFGTARVLADTDVLNLTPQETAG